MSVPGLYFAIYYDVPDRAFYRSAMTWGLETFGGVCRADTPFALEMVATETDFNRAWQSIADRAAAEGLQVIEGLVASHASKGSPNDGLEFRRGESDDGTLSQSEALALPKLPWAADGQLTLTGCNTGLAGTRGWTPASVFARGQGVKTVGMAGYGYFSTNKCTYSEISPNSQTVYLWAYKRARNGMFGGGERMPGITFEP